MVSTTSHRITYTILSMSLLTVMAGAAVAPALATMFEHFSDCPKVLVQLIVSIPAFFIILTNLLFLEISRHFGSRTIALAGLVLYVASGVCCFFCHGYRCASGDEGFAGRKRGSRHAAFHGAAGLLLSSRTAGETNGTFGGDESDRRGNCHSSCGNPLHCGLELFVSCLFARLDSRGSRCPFPAR